MYQRLTLDNGLRIVYEHIPSVRSAAIGIWVGVGSRFEKANDAGICHYIEHMVFKGTERRSASDIAAEMDAVGGQINAFTSKDCTCFYGRVLGEHLSAAVDVLCDMFFNSRFDESDMKNELGVILEEIGMYEDSPEDLVFDRLFERIFASSPLGHPVLGREATLRKMTGERLRRFMGENYTAAQTVIALCGCFTDEDLKNIADRFSSMAPGKKKPFRPAQYKRVYTVKKKAIEQNHLCFAFPSMSVDNPDRFAMQLISSILGGGMSSRLFQNVREKRGLCYAVYSFGATHAETGLFCVYTALSRETEQEAIRAVTDELKQLRDDGVTRAELERAREQVKSNVLMGLESTSSLANSYGKSELALGRILSADDIINEYNAVTLEQVARLARETIDFSAMSFSAVGRTKTAEEYEKLIADMI